MLVKRKPLKEYAKKSNLNDLGLFISFPFLILRNLRAGIVLMLCKDGPQKGPSSWIDLSIVKGLSISWDLFSACMWEICIRLLYGDLSGLAVKSWMNSFEQKSWMNAAFVNTFTT